MTNFKLTEYAGHYIKFSIKENGKSKIMSGKLVFDTKLIRYIIKDKPEINMNQAKNISIIS
jgi:hypothetical protein